MSGKTAGAGVLRSRGFVVRLIAYATQVALIAIILFLLFRGVPGCVNILKNAEYEDPDEAAWLGQAQATEPAQVYSDSDYDIVYPDLVE